MTRRKQGNAQSPLLLIYEKCWHLNFCEVEFCRFWCRSPMNFLVPHLHQIISKQAQSALRVLGARVQEKAHRITALAVCHRHIEPTPKQSLLVYGLLFQHQSRGKLVCTRGFPNPLNSCSETQECLR